MYSVEDSYIPRNHDLKTTVRLTLRHSMTMLAVDTLVSEPKF